MDRFTWGTSQASSPADIYVRFQRLNRRDVLHVCGSDEHGVYHARARREV